MILTQDILLKLVLAIIIGGVLGAEWEYRSKSAGFRTLTLICPGSTLFTIFSQVIGGAGNPDRIASNIVTGIGFVGAGVIFKGDSTSKVNGITTAAMIWVTAALGMTIGAGYWLVAIVATGLTLVVLFLFSLVEDKIDQANQLRKYRIVCLYETGYRTKSPPRHPRADARHLSKGAGLLIPPPKTPSASRCAQRSAPLRGD
ncbi:MgtC/SapB family protein [Puia sp.]|jgi:putative Mg2+ transporter-C (MgtC) family protein|uniref:MgtC/SapB family protein n=1 Tax=Puia sp. TaxID=2045100 RepID=UPI002F3EE642